MEQFNIPIVVFSFKREKVVQIIERISCVKPKKIYLISDGGRNDTEWIEVIECRKKMEKAITWNCEVIKRYADSNRGVCANIGLGAKWVFEREEIAIFLEDDNLPDPTFFKFCQEMLEKYKNDTRILWICGTNYLGEYLPADGSSYMFTKHMLPCGWASWAQKFNYFYDETAQLCDDKYVMERAMYEYDTKVLGMQQLNAVKDERKHVLKNERCSSWDYQMDLAVRINGLYGISPCVNLIKNIGVDEHSIHGGSSLDNIMTRRFCEIDTYPIQFPLKHPKVVLSDLEYERKITKIVTYPFLVRFRSKIAIRLKHILHISNDQRVIVVLRNRLKRGYDEKK